MPFSVKQLVSALLVSIIIAAALISCGKIGDPVPPGKVLSQPGTDR